MVSSPHNYLADNSLVGNENVENVRTRARPLSNIVPINDSGIEIESSLDIIDTDEDIENVSPDYQENQTKVSKTRTKPARPCVFCRKPQSRLKRHILSQHSTHSRVIPLLTMNKKEQDRYIADLRREGIREFNTKQVNLGKSDFMRERRNFKDTDIPVMCSGCKGFFSRKYKARHQMICPENGSNLMLPMVSVEQCQGTEQYSVGFRNLLNTLHQDKVGDYIKTDKIILMIGNRSFSALKRKKDKKTETSKYVRARMRLTARIYMAFRDEYAKQRDIKLEEKLNNAADIYRREVITVLGRAINQLCEKSTDGDVATAVTVTGQKSGLKINILNLLKLTAKLLIGHFLIQNLDARSKMVVDFVQVLRLFQDELFGDAYYDLSYRKNVKNRKPLNLPRNDDVQLLLHECEEVMKTADMFDISGDSYVSLRAATVTYLIIYNARRGGEPVRLQVQQWKEALNGEWVDNDMEEEEETDDELVTYQTGKGANHLVPVFFPPVTHTAMKYLTDKEIRRNAGVLCTNEYIFASTQNSASHASGWHSINSILERLQIKGAINATQNRHRVASLLSHLKLTEKEKELIYKHFGHSKNINENVYQAAAGSLQLATTAQKLQLINQRNPELEKFKTGNNSETTEKLTHVLKEVNYILLLFYWF